MSEIDTGLLLDGPEEVLSSCLKAWKDMPVDWDLSGDDPAPVREKQTTIAREISVTGPGTFHGKSARTLTLKPSDKQGWRFDRLDLPDCLPVRVSPETVWTTGDIVSNIVLRSGPPQNYIRMVEHIIALKLGSTIDNLVIGIDSGDPPLFNRGSLDLVDALDQAGCVEQDRPVRYITVKEPVSIAHPSGRALVVGPSSSSPGGRR